MNCYNHAKGSIQVARTKNLYICQQCGSVHPKWSGKCEACGAWNALIEEQAEAGPPKSLGSKKGKALELEPLKGQSHKIERFVTGIGEFDRVCGGGLVPGGVLLVGGDPGIGKSTLLLQIMAKIPASLNPVYISGEEGIDQIRMRASRLGIDDAPVQLAAETNVRDMLASLDVPDGPKVVVIDSIQTMYVDHLESAPGTVVQVRGSASELIRVAKKRNIAIILVGHVTKEGQIAGPRLLEHMVDAVLYLEGDRGHHFRILRGVKNRFGPTDEIGVFEMTEQGVQQVLNPSSLFLGHFADENDGPHISGAVVFAGIEGTRPVLVEIQALVSPSPFSSPKRSVVGWDTARLSMILAVLETRCGLSIGAHDVYLNVAGGLRISEPAADLAVAAALISCFSGTPAPAETIIFGELGLSSEVRPVGHTEQRLKEAAKLGFKKAIMPKPAKTRQNKPPSGIQTLPISRLADLIAMLDQAPKLRKAN